MELTLGEIVTATSGRLDVDFARAPDRGSPSPDETDLLDVVVGSFAFDTRTLEPGACFVALAGERDGHEFVADAFERGAVAAIVARRSRGSRGPLVVVADPLRALADLGRLARERLARAQVVAVTGSAGKTATKDLTAAACARTLSVHASPGSYNNEFGLPLTLLASDVRADVVVTEMGARFAGNIAELCAVARPDVGVVTHIGLAHAEHLGGREGIARVKGELLEALPDSGLAVLNADDGATRAPIARTRASVLRVGVDSPSADVLVSDVSLDDELRPRFHLATSWGVADVRLAVRGYPQVMNAAMAAGVALFLGVDLDDVAAGLSTATTASRRMQLARTAGGIVVLDDAYNSSPTSLAAALDSFASLRAAGRKIAVLGAMLELGEAAEGEHGRMGEEVAAAGVDVLVAVGPATGAAAAAARKGGVEVVEVSGTRDAITATRDLARPGDAVLVKASRAVGLDVVADDLLGVEAVPR